MSDLSKSQEILNPKPKKLNDAITETLKLMETNRHNKDLNKQRINFDQRISRISYTDQQKKDMDLDQRIKKRLNIENAQENRGKKHNIDWEIYLCVNHYDCDNRTLENDINCLQLIKEIKELLMYKTGYEYNIGMQLIEKFKGNQEKLQDLYDTIDEDLLI